MDLRLTVAVAPGAVLQDRGRLRAHRGLSTGGARDAHAARSANALVGNAADAPVVEVVLGSFAAVPDRDALVAATGAAELEVGGVRVAPWAPVAVPAGAVVAVRAADGVAAYLGVAGRLAAPRFAGSAAPDPALGFATAPVPGAVLVVHRAPDRLLQPALGVALIRPIRDLQPRIPGAVGLLPGPDGTAALLDALAAGPFTVDPRSDHVGVRLAGALPPPAPRPEPVSRGVPVGAVELPGATGEVIVLQRGRSLTAGYPVVAVVPRIDQDRIAQLLPGDEVRFERRDVDRARADARSQRAAERAAERAVRAALDALRSTAPRSGER